LNDKYWLFWAMAPAGCITPPSTYCCRGAPDWVVYPGNRFVLVFLPGADGRYRDGVVYESDRTVAAAAFPFA
jgi:hypothetical protein